LHTGFLGNIILLHHLRFSALSAALENSVFDSLDTFPAPSITVHSVQKLVEERDQLDSDLQQFRKMNTGSQHEGQIAALQRKLGDSEGEKKKLQQLLDTAAQEMDKLKQAVCIPNKND
jgi:hypothetical protein